MMMRRAFFWFSMKMSVFIDGKMDEIADVCRQLPAFFYSLPRGSLKTATIA
jgi:pyridoxine/pyridoxamine 5'-phosphate oxidase